MSDFIGNIEVPEIVPSGVFPIVSDWGFGSAHAPSVAIHQFGTSDAKTEQRFLLGNGTRTFIVRKQVLTKTDRLALVSFWEGVYGAFGAFTYNAPFEDGSDTEEIVCRFADEPISLEFLTDAICSTGITLIEIPQLFPTYALNSTQTRFPSVSLKNALLSQVQEIIPLIKIQPKESGYPAIYVSDRRCTVGTQLYQARLLDWDGIEQGIGNESDEARFTLGNADRVMRNLANDTDLVRASLEFSLFHVGTGIKLDLWAGEISDWEFDAGPEFTITAVDGLYELTLPYPCRRILRTCWKCFDDALGCPYTAESTGLDTTNFPSVDEGTCDKGYDSLNGCLAHGMKHYFGGVLSEPQGVRIKDNSQGTWGIGRPTVTAASIVNDSVYDQVVPEIYTNNETYKDADGNVKTGRLVNCKIAAGRDESDFYAALGIVGEGPITFGTGHKLDGQFHHGQPGSDGLREILGTDPAGDHDFFSLSENGTSTADWRKAVYAGQIFKDNFAAGLAALEIRRHDDKGMQLSYSSSHEMQAVVATGLHGWIWTGAGSRTWSVLTNPVWIVVNIMLKARGLRYASASVCEQYFNVSLAVASAATCNLSVPPLIARTLSTWNSEAESWEEGAVTAETQFKFQGILQEEKPLRDWIQEVLMNCIGYFTFDFKKLAVGIRSNAIVTELFTEGNILFKSLQIAPLRPSFNHLTANFGDADFNYSANSVVIYDIDHAKQIGGATAPLFLKSQMNLCGVSAKSQAARVITTRLREELGGTSQSERTSARRLTFDTTVLAVNAKVGSVCGIIHDDMPSIPIPPGELDITFSLPEVKFQSAFPDAGSDEPNWGLAGKIATQSNNAKPSILLGAEEFSGADENELSGFFMVNDADGDDDYIGFAINYQDSKHFYLFDWRRATQNGWVFGVGDYGTANVGMTVKKVSVATEITNELWPTAGGSGVTILASDSTPWAGGIKYKWTLSLRIDGFTVKIENGETVVATLVISDTTWTSGKFGFYNYSQAGVTYGVGTSTISGFRISSWKLNKDYSITLSGQTCVDSMYDLTAGYTPPDEAPIPGPPEVVPLVGGPPQELSCGFSSTGLAVTMTCRAMKYNDNVTLAQFKYKFYASGATLPDYVDLSDESTYPTEELAATYAGALKTITAAEDGIIFYAFRLFNGAWSLWSDGNLSPTKVTQKAMTQAVSVAVTNCITVTPSAGHAAIDCSLGKSFHLATGGSSVEIDNPTNPTDHKPFLIRITGTGDITLGTKFNSRGATLTRSASGRDYLGCMYDSSADKFDCWWSKDA